MLLIRARRWFGQLLGFEHLIRRHQYSCTYNKSISNTVTRPVPATSAEQPRFFSCSRDCDFEFAIQFTIYDTDATPQGVAINLELEGFLQTCSFGSDGERVCTLNLNFEGVNATAMGNVGYGRGREQSLLFFSSSWDTLMH